MKVAIVTQAFWEGGGIPATVEWLIRELPAFDVEIEIHDLAASSVDDMSRRLRRPTTWFRSSLRRDGAGVTHWGANAVELEFMRYMPRRQLTRALNKVDLVQVVSGGPALGLATRRVRPPVVIQMATFVAWERDHSRSVRRRPIDWWRALSTRITSRLEQLAIAESHAVLVMNDEVRSHLANRAPTADVVLLPPGVDTDRFKPAELQDPNAYLLCVGRLVEPRKGFERLLHAYAVFRTSDPAAPGLVIAGRGTAPPALVELCRELGIAEFVQIQEDVPERGLPDLYRGAKAFVQASYEEGLGIAVLEAMASGLPVAATDTAGTRETVLDGVTGVLVPQGDDADVAADLARAIRQTLAAGDPFGRAAREHVVNTFSSRAQASRVASLYKDIVPAAEKRGRTACAD